MRSPNNFHPEWGCLAPAPGFIRTVRVVLLATAIGAMLGGGVVFSLVGHSATEVSVSARTMAGSVEAASVHLSTAGLTNSQSPIELSLPSRVANQPKDAAPSLSSASSTKPAPEGTTVSADTATSTDNTPVRIAAAGPTAVISVPASNPTPTKMKSTKKLNVTSRSASHGEPFRLAPRENRLKGSSDEYHETWWGSPSTQGSPAAFLLSLGGIVTRVLGQPSP